jgi:hypothetical protein
LEQIQKSLKSERSNSAMNTEQAEYNSKMAMMEKEMSYYKEKLSKLNSTKSGNNNRQSEMESAAFSQVAGQSTGSFHMQSTTGLYTDSIMSMRNGGEGSTGPTTESFVSGSTQKIKVSKKDLRRLTEEEMLKRSSQQSKHF